MFTRVSRRDRGGAGQITVSWWTAGLERGPEGLTSRIESRQPMTSHSRNAVCACHRPATLDPCRARARGPDRPLSCATKLAAPYRTRGEMLCPAPPRSLREIRVNVPANSTLGAAGELARFGVDFDLFAVFDEERDADFEAGFEA